MPSKHTFMSLIKPPFRIQLILKDLDYRQFLLPSSSCATESFTTRIVLPRSSIMAGTAVHLLAGGGAGQLTGGGHQPAKTVSRKSILPTNTQTVYGTDPYPAESVTAWILLRVFLPHTRNNDVVCRRDEKK